MPFTIAHVAVIYPFRRSKIRISATAFIVGTMVPDFEDFILMRHVRYIGHHWTGIFLFDLPAGLVSCYLFHHLFKSFLLMNTPELFRHQYLTFNWSGYVRSNPLLILISLLAGIFSHLFLDGFTHRDGLIVGQFPFLLSKINIITMDMPLFFALQLAFSLVGLFLMIKVIKTEIASFNLLVKYFSRQLIVLFSVALILFLLRLFIYTAYNSFLDLIKSLCGALIYSLLLVSFLHRKSLSKKLMRTQL